MSAYAGKFAAVTGEAINLRRKFANTDLSTELKMIDLNCRRAVQLTRFVPQDMVARDNGTLLFTSSIDADMPDPLAAKAHRVMSEPGAVKG